MSSPRDPYGEEACPGGLRLSQRQKALVLTSARRALDGGTLAPSLDHVLSQHLRLSHHQTIVPFDATVWATVDWL